jgi:hypothetical protein
LLCKQMFSSFGAHFLSNAPVSSFVGNGNWEISASRQTI